MFALRFSNTFPVIGKHLESRHPVFHSNSLKGKLEIGKTSWTALGLENPVWLIRKKEGVGR